MIVFAIGFGLVGFVAGAIISAAIVSYIVNSRWRLNATEPMYLKYDGKFYKVIDQGVPKSWEYAQIRLKRKSR